MSLLSEENKIFFRDGQWHTSQIGACEVCGWTCSGAVWKGDPCGNRGCKGKMGTTRNVQSGRR